MSKAPVVAAGWVLTLVAAFFVGRAVRGTDAGPAEAGAPAGDAGRVEALEHRVEDLTRRLAEERRRGPRPPTAREWEEATAADTTTAKASAPAGDAQAAGAAASAGESREFSVEGITDPSEFSRRLMAFADANLSRGDEGHAAIVDALVTLQANEELLQGLFNDEATAIREIYPWVKFLVQREAKVVDLCEYVFRTMAEKPDALAKLPNDNMLEPLTEGLAMLRPDRAYVEDLFARGVVPEDVAEQLRTAYGIK